VVVLKTGVLGGGTVCALFLLLSLLMFIIVSTAAGVNSSTVSTLIGGLFLCFSLFIVS
jgi:hypothetical protein